MATRNRSGRQMTGRWVLLGFALGIGAADAAYGAVGEDARAVSRGGAGRDLFLREWVPGIPSERGGDGLGPVYNETSCVACHNQGGVGGAGGADRNVDLATATVTPIEDTRTDMLADLRATRRTHRADRAKSTGAAEPPPPRAKGEAVDRGPLVKLHAGFAQASSVAVHRFGPGREYGFWRLTVLDPDGASFAIMRSRSALGGARDEARIIRANALSRGRIFPGEFGHFSLVRSERNPVALFGAGRIDAIPDSVLEAAEQESFKVRSSTAGRVARMADGRIGRFGWKAQSPTLDDFVRTACAVELGLEVPSHPQGRDPRDRSAPRATKLDLLRVDCDTLAAFVGALPAPGRRASPRDAGLIAKGEARFTTIGCASCHRPTLGNVEGLYSDLLLHDMGSELSDSGSYGSMFLRPSETSEPDGLPPAFPSGLDAFAGPWQRARPASRQEWRTPPLWGVRDSAPYLHDGRADTLEQAIALHGGQGQRTADTYFWLSPAERAEVLAFLKSLVAPGTDDRPPTEAARHDAQR